MLALFAIVIFVLFAVVGGIVVWLIVSNERDSGPDDLPPRGIPWDSPENQDR